jgi:hypothetical protein
MSDHIVSFVNGPLDFRPVFFPVAVRPNIRDGVGTRKRVSGASAVRRAGISLYGNGHSEKSGADVEAK